MLGILKKIVGSKNDRELKRMAPVVDRVNAVEPMISSYSMFQRLQNPAIFFRGRVNLFLRMDGIIARVDKSDSE